MLEVFLRDAMVFYSLLFEIVNLGPMGKKLEGF